ncbi:MAG TPA: hypothetical protein VMB52_02260 [Verrucomicrobiae bacterium]|nr:hypothetical protein [Verrucomicrobiae bacterium]
MQSFIVLGIIPGTTIQTTFNFWVALSVLMLVLVLRRQIVMARRRTQTYIAARRIAHTIDSYTL